MLSCLRLYVDRFDDDENKCLQAINLNIAQRWMDGWLDGEDG